MKKRGEDERQGFYLVNRLQLQPIQAELRVPLPFLHAQHWLSVDQIMEGTLGRGGGRERESQQLLSLASLGYNSLGSPTIPGLKFSTF